jgi:hypothetical protein
MIAPLLWAASMAALQGNTLGRMQPVELARAVAEFESVCLSPMFDPARTREATQSSSFRYETISNRATLWSSWSAPQIWFELALTPPGRIDGYATPSCHMLAVAGPRFTAADVQALMRAAVTRRFGAVFRDRLSNSIWRAEWPAGQPGWRYMVLATIDEGEIQDMSFSLSLTSPWGRSRSRSLAHQLGMPYEEPLE